MTRSRADIEDVSEAWLREALHRACAVSGTGRRRRLQPLLDRVLSRACGRYAIWRLATMFSYLPAPERNPDPPATVTISLDLTTREEESGLLEAHRSLLLTGNGEDSTRFVVLSGRVEMDDRSLPLQQPVDLRPMDRCVVRAGSRLLFSRAAASSLLVAGVLAGFVVMPRAAPVRVPSRSGNALSVVSRKQQ